MFTVAAMETLLQLLASILLFVLCAVIHGTGLVFASKIFDAEDRELRRQKLAAREFGTMVPMALCLFLMHLAEVLLYAIFYWSVGSHGSLADAVFHSASAYTTLGLPDPAPHRWRLVAALEGLTGFLLIGWSAAIFVTDMEKVLRKRA